LKKGAPAARRRASAAQMLSIPLPHTAAPPRVYGRSKSHGASSLALLLKLCSRFGTAHEKNNRVEINRSGLRRGGPNITSLFLFGNGTKSFEDTRERSTSDRVPFCAQIERAFLFVAGWTGVRPHPDRPYYLASSSYVSFFFSPACLTIQERLRLGCVHICALNFDESLRFGSPETVTGPRTQKDRGVKEMAGKTEGRPTSISAAPQGRRKPYSSLYRTRVLPE